jgi:hypothetical protein
LTQDAQRARYKDVMDLLARWLGWSEQAHTESSEHTRDEDAQHPAAAPETPAASSAPSGPPRAALSVPERLDILRNTLEFDPGLRSRLATLHSAPELLGCIREELLSRFSRLRDLGLIDPSSARALDFLDDKMGAVLADHTPGGTGSAAPDHRELLRENAELKERIERLYSKYVTTGMVTETELKQEQEITALKSKAWEQQEQLALAQKRLKLLISYQEMVQNLKNKNTLLNSKVEHQGKLLRSLTAENPKHQELVSAVEKLSEENRLLKLDLERQSGLLNQLRSCLTGDALTAVEGLIDRNVRLQADLDERQVRLDGAKQGEGSPVSLLDQVETLTEDNLHLKNLLETKQFIDKFIKNHREGTQGNPQDIIKALKAENQRLDHALKEKEEQIKAFELAPANTPLVAAYTSLQGELKDLFRENQLKDQLYRHEQDEKKVLQAQARERTALIRENQQLRAEVETGRRWIEAARNAEHLNAALNKEISELRIKYEENQVEIARTKQEMADLKAEYTMLIETWEKAFGER